MMRLFRSLAMFLALLGLAAGGAWDVAYVHLARAAAPEMRTMHQHAATDSEAVRADHASDHSVHHQQQAAGSNICLDTAALCDGDMPDYMGGMCCGAVACHMAVLPLTSVAISAVALRAANPLRPETFVEGTSGPRLERPPRSLAG